MWRHISIDGLNILAPKPQSPFTGQFFLDDDILLLCLYSFLVHSYITYLPNSLLLFIISLKHNLLLHKRTSLCTLRRCTVLYIYLFKNLEKINKPSFLETWEGSLGFCPLSELLTSIPVWNCLFSKKEEQTLNIWSFFSVFTSGA